MSLPCLQLLLLVLLSTVLSQAQERITVQSGHWNAPSTWSGGTIPSAENSTSVIVAHTVTISGESSVTIDGLVITGTLVVDPDAELNIVDGGSVDLALTPGGALEVRGTLVGYDSVDFDGMTVANSRFHAGSVYRHLAAKEGNIPVAQWDPSSTFELGNFSGGAYMTSPNWGQTFGNLVYNCPGQGAFVEFNSLLKRIAGNLIIINTNSNILRLSGSKDSNLEVSGNILIEGLSEVWFSGSGNCSVSVGGEFQYKSTSGASSYFTTTGQANITVNGDFIIDAEHIIKMASSTSTGHTNLVLLGDGHFLNGRLDALGTGSGTIVFAGTQPQHVFASPTADAFDGNISYRIEHGADVDLHQSLITNTTGGDLIVEGTIRLGSTSETGIIQAGNEGNIQVEGSIIFGEASRIIFNGTRTQHISYPDLNTNVMIDNPSGIVLHANAQFGNLAIDRGRFLGGSHTIRLSGNLSRQTPGRIEHEGTLMLNGVGEQVLDIRGDTLNHVVIEQEVTGMVRLVSPLHLSGALTVQSPGSGVVSDGNLTLLSSSESAGATASIGRLPGGSAILGAVTVQRFIGGAAGDYYRYFSSAVVDATVASLMDDVAVTGIFDDADSGSGLPHNTPSLFYYDEEVAAWEPYPVSGTSSASLFAPGKGYCFFNWNEAMDTYWDVTGEINQGTVYFDLTYTPGDPELAGWNLIGNPYPSTVAWGETGWVSDNVGASIAVRDYRSGGFLYSDGQTGSLPGGLIAAGQAFWVRSTGANPSLRIDEDAKAGDGAMYYRIRTPDFLEMTVRVGAQYDKAYLRVRERSSDGLDSFDAPKLRNDSLSVSFRTSDNVNVAINAVPGLSCVSEIPLTIDGLDGKNDLHFAIHTEGIVSELSFAITDTTTGRRYDFDERGLTTIAGNVNPGALRLVITSGISQEANGFTAFPNPCRDILHITFPDDSPVIRVYTMGGRLAGQAEVHREEGGCLIDFSRVPTGNYLIHILGKSNPITIRLVKIE